MEHARFGDAPCPITIPQNPSFNCLARSNRGRPTAIRSLRLEINRTVSTASDTTNDQSREGVDSVAPVLRLFSTTSCNRNLRISRTRTSMSRIRPQFSKPTFRRRESRSAHFPQVGHRWRAISARECNIGSSYRKVTETIYSSRVSPVGLRHRFKSFHPGETQALLTCTRLLRGGGE